MGLRQVCVENMTLIPSLSALQPLHFTAGPVQCCISLQQSPTDGPGFADARSQDRRLQRDGQEGYVACCSRQRRTKIISCAIDVAGPGRPSNIVKSSASHLAATLAAKQAQVAD